MAMRHPTKRKPRPYKHPVEEDKINIKFLPRPGDRMVLLSEQGSTLGIWEVARARHGDQDDAMVIKIIHIHGK
jgi:hypothetical protein